MKKLNLYLNCEQEIELLKAEIKLLKEDLKTMKDDDQIEYTEYLIEAKQVRIGDLEGQQAEQRYIDNGTASDYEGF